MARIPWTNPKSHPVHVGGKRVDPGETRDVDVALVQTPAPTAGDPEPDPDAAYRRILGHRVGEVTEMLGTLQTADLDRLETLESDAANPRKGVLEAIEAERLERAKAGDQSDGGGDAMADDEALAQFRGELADMPANELQDLRTLYDVEGYEAYLQAIDAELERQQGTKDN